MQAKLDQARARHDELEEAFSKYSNSVKAHEDSEQRWRELQAGGKAPPAAAAVAMDTTAAEYKMMLNHYKTVRTTVLCLRAVLGSVTAAAELDRQESQLMEK